MKKTENPELASKLVEQSKIDRVPCFKIVDLDEDGKNIKFLFHGVFPKDRSIPYYIWLRANQKWAGEGGQKYWTGIHVFISMDIAKKYFAKFTDKTKKRVIVRCWGKNLVPKKSSRGNVFLAEQILVPEVWIDEKD